MNLNELIKIGEELKKKGIDPKDVKFIGDVNLNCNNSGFGMFLKKDTIIKFTNSKTTTTIKELKQKYNGKIKTFVVVANGHIEIHINEE